MRLPENVNIETREGKLPSLHWQPVHDTDLKKSRVSGTRSQDSNNRRAIVLIYSFNICNIIPKGTYQVK